MALTCDECDSHLLRDEWTGDYVCSSCGLASIDPVFSRIIPRPIGDSRFRAQLSPPTGHPQLGTFIGHHRAWVPPKLIYPALIQKLTVSQPGLIRLAKSVCQDLGIETFAVRVRDEALKIQRYCRRILKKTVYLAHIVCTAVYQVLQSSPGSIPLKHLCAAVKKYRHICRPKLILRLIAQIPWISPTNATVACQYITSSIDAISRDERVTQKLARLGTDVGTFRQKLERETRELYYRLKSDLESRGYRPYNVIQALIYGASLEIKKGILTQQLIADINRLSLFSLRQAWVQLVNPLIQEVS